MMETTCVNRWDFRCRRNDDRVDAAVTVGGRLFQALEPAAEKDRSPSVDLRVAGSYVRCDAAVSVLIDFFLDVIFSACCVYPNSLYIIRCLHFESAIISEIAVIPINFQICSHQTALTSIQLTTKCGA